MRREEGGARAKRGLKFLDQKLTKVSQKVGKINRNLTKSRPKSRSKSGPTLELQKLSTGWPNPLASRARTAGWDVRFSGRPAVGTKNWPVGSGTFGQPRLAIGGLTIRFLSVRQRQTISTVSQVKAVRSGATVTCDIAAVNS